MTLRALLFDMDGTVIDSDPIHARVFVDFLGARGLEIDEADYVRRFHGRRNEEIFAELLPDQDPHALDAAKEAAFRDVLAVTDIAPTPGLLPLINGARARGIATALVTNACRANAEAVLAKFDIAPLFDTVSLAEDVARGKPDPAVYREALIRLGQPADAALAFEDSPAGIASARGAGLEVVGIASTLSVDELVAQGASHAVTDFTDTALARWLEGSDLQGAVQ
ncbi:MAG: HAD family phosphatase [Pseudomonadota bacterium]